MAFKEIPIAETISSPLSDFPIYVKPSALTGWTSLTQAEADSIRFYADEAKTTELPREVVSSDEIHVKKGTLSDGDSIYADYDGVQADYADTDTFGAENVWNSNYALVSHDGGGTDSTSNGNNGTANGGVTIGGTTGQIGSATEFDGGGNTYIDTKFTAPTGEQERTIQLWLKANNSGDRKFFGYQGSDDGSNYDFTVENDSSENLSILYRHGGGNIAFGSVNLNQFYKVSTVVPIGASTTDDVYIFIDGQKDNGSRNAGGDQNLASSNFSNLFIGSNGVSNPSFDGDIDEFRVLTKALPTDWEQTEYNNQNDPATFFGTVSDVNPAPTANDDTASTDQDQNVNIDVLANDTEPDGEALTVDSVTQPTNGAATIEADDTITYDPDASFFGSDSFTYTISDTQGATDTATVTVVVGAVDTLAATNVGETSADFNGEIIHIET